MSKRNNRLGNEKLNCQNSVMRIVEYIDAMNIIVEFQDEHKARVKTEYKHYKSGKVKNPYLPSVFGVGMIGSKYPSNTKEYVAWKSMLNRCYYHKIIGKNPTYKEVVCCNEWLLYEKFYEWLHSQSNFDRWINGEKWCLDKDILIKGSKVYSPETCCLVPQNINNIFVKNKSRRGNLPIGVIKSNDKFGAMFNQEYLGTFDTPEQAFFAYKKEKESHIKQVAQEEFNNGNITKQCYNAMMNYEVEIAD